MADDEVDWEFDDTLEEDWRGGTDLPSTSISASASASASAPAVGEESKKDVKGDAEARRDLSTESQADSANNNVNGNVSSIDVSGGGAATGTNGKAPPSGPRRSLNRPTGPRASSNPPVGPRAQETAITDRQANAKTADVVDKQAHSQQSSTTVPAPLASKQKPESQEPPLPEGWVSHLSRSQGRHFYEHKATKTITWERPTAPIETPSTPPLPESTSAVESEPKQVPESTKSASALQVEKAVPVAEVAQVLSEQKRIPTGPASNAAVTDRERETKPVAGSDPVASAYAARLGRPTSSVPSGPSKINDARDRDSDRGGKRDVQRGNEQSYSRQADQDRRRPRSPLPSDGPYDAKRFKSDDGRRRSPVSVSSSNAYPRQRSPPRSSIPQEPRRFAGDRSARSPPRQRPVEAPQGPIGREQDSRYRSSDRLVSRADDRSRPPIPKSPPHRQPPPALGQPTKGANTAPLAVNRWGSGSAPSSTPGTPGGTNKNIASARPVAQAAPTASVLPPPSGGTESAETKRARLREEARQAQEKLRQVQEEEERLEREEAEKKKKADEAASAKTKRDAEEKGRIEVNKLDPLPSRGGDRFAPPPANANAGSRGVPPPKPSTGYDSYRPGDVDDTPRLPLSARIGPPPRDARDARERDWARDRRPISPIRRPLSPPRAGRLGPRMPSPPRRNGDSYYPGPNDRPLDFPPRMGRRPEHIAEPMSDRNRERGSGWREPNRDWERDRDRRRSPPPQLAERMSRPRPGERDGDAGGRGNDRSHPLGRGGFERK